MLNFLYFNIHFFSPLQKEHSNLENLPFQIPHSCLTILTSRNNIHILWNNYILIEKLLTLRISKYYGRIHYLGTSLIYSIRNKTSDVCLFSIWKDERSQELRHTDDIKTQKFSGYRTRKRNNQIKENNTKHNQRKNMKKKREMELIKSK